MSTYYYMLLDAPIREGLTEDDARTILEDAFGVAPHRLNTYSLDPCYVDNRIPFRVGSGDVEETDPTMDGEGWTVRDRRVVAHMMIDNLMRDCGTEIVEGVEVQDTRTRYEAMFDRLSRVIGGSDGLIVGSLGSEHGDAMGPIVRHDDKVSHSWSNASDPLDMRGARGWLSNAPEDYEPITRIPTDMVTQEGEERGSCSIDVDRLKTWIESGMIDAAAIA